MPDPEWTDAGSKPAPSSATVTSISVPLAATVTSTELAEACRQTLLRASLTMRDTIVSVVQSRTMSSGIATSSRGGTSSPYRLSR
jgi:hypothetical protein